MYNIVSHRNNTPDQLRAALTCGANSVEIDLAAVDGNPQVMHPGPDQPPPMGVAEMLGIIAYHEAEGNITAHEFMIDVKPFAFSPQAGPHFGDGEIPCLLTGLEWIVPYLWNYGLSVAISCETYAFLEQLAEQRWWQDRDPSNGSAVLFLHAQGNGTFTLPDDVNRDIIQEIGFIHKPGENTEELFESADIFGSMDFSLGISVVPVKDPQRQQFIAALFAHQMERDFGIDPRVVTDFPLEVSAMLNEDAE